MNLNGKKVVFLGDSITEGCGVTEQKYRYPEVFRDISGATVEYYGISGTRFARQTVPSEMPRFDLCFLDRALEMDADADVVVVFGGTNDFGHGDALFGEFSDRDEYTFYGATHNLCLRLINKYPAAKIVFMTPLHRLQERNTHPKTGKERTLKEYVDAIKEVCAYYALPVLDLYTTSGIQPAVPVIMERYMPDGLHPSNDGAKLIAERLLGFLSSL
jgi:lysophospholipase L1-like esterase